MEDNFIIIFVTCSSKKEAKNITGLLLKKRLIACANIISGVESNFWWQGKVDKSKEVMAVLKTKRANFKKIEKEIKRIHSYDVPEIIAVPIIAGSGDYLKWIGGSVRPPCRDS